MPHTSIDGATGLLLMSPDDNCLIARADFKAGDRVIIDGDVVILPTDVRLGHKVARFPLKTGEKVFRYGAHIGTTTASIPVGGHIHTHNLKSDYIPTYTLQPDSLRFIGGKLL